MTFEDEDRVSTWGLDVLLCSGMWLCLYSKDARVYVQQDVVVYVH